GRVELRPGLPAADVGLLVQCGVAALPAARHHRHVARAVALAGQRVETLLVCGGREAVIGGVLRPALLAEDHRVTDRPAAEMAFDLVRPVALARVLVEALLVLAAVQAVERGPGAGLGPEQHVVVDLAADVEAVDPVGHVAGRDGLVEQGLVVGGGYAAARDFGGAGPDLAGHLARDLGRPGGEHAPGHPAHAHHAVALAAGVVPDEPAHGGDRIGGAQHGGLDVQVWSARAADVALVAQVGARGDGLADLQAGLAGGGVLFEVAVLDRHAVDAADPDVVVLLLAAGQVLAGQALAVAVLDVGDDAVAGGHDPVGAAALAAHVVAPLGRVRVVVASDPDPGAV